MAKKYKWVKIETVDGQLVVKTPGGRMVVAHCDEVTGAIKVKAKKLADSMERLWANNAKCIKAWESGKD